MRAKVLILFMSCAACSSGMRRFPLRAPLTRDTDLDARNVPCRPDPDPKKPGHKLCLPKEYESSFAWDGADNIVFRPLARFFAVDPPDEAANVNSMDEVPDSSWFTNRLGQRAMGIDELMRGSCEDEVLDVDGADGSWVIDQGKPNGANPGFRIKLGDGRKYMLKSDLGKQPERATSATAIASRLYHAAGWYVACDTAVYIRPELLKLTPGLKVTDNTGTTRPFDEKALSFLLGNASHRGNLVRFAASRWLPGRTLGPFTYAGIRDDDPGDIIPHENRRDLRGARLIAAWLGHFDSREQNSMTSWISEDPKDPEASPGRLLHYYIDLGDSFGSAWTEEIWKRIGHAYYFDIGYLVADFLTLGVIERPWERARREPHIIFGYYSAKEFDPEAWRGGYPNPSFNRMTERDGAWAARIIARFTDEHVAALVRVGDFTDPQQSAYLLEQMIGRRDAILRRYLGRVSPVTDLTVERREDKDELCGVDLARKTRVYGEAPFQYRARIRAGKASKESPAETQVLPDGRLCIGLAHRQLPADMRSDDPERYVTVDIHNGLAPRALHAHLYDVGPERGFVLVGIERD